MVQGVQAGEGLFGHGSDLVPLKVSKGGRKEKKKSKPIKLGNQLGRSLKFVAPHFGAGNIPEHRSRTYSFFSLSSAEKGPFMSSMVQEISFFWRSLPEEKKTGLLLQQKKTKQNKKTHLPHLSNDCELQWK